ncbi:MAG: uroporphyrinogen-III synthase [Ardenticatenaceae bacterium]|nr:uroporphyrinogen-III synthase [Anaerolineales bacterium]MCB8941369.1 uroporphyrinogen-III synthase [Ardenticatenaceae bacterium]MCB8972725.1 uroporphyrinogen-III synthase [Ardenticatenaceae bacterium]
MSNRPRVLVTRTANQADAFSHTLKNHGFIPVEFPAIQLEPLPWGPLDRALATLNQYDWLIFTSGNAVEFFLRRVDEKRLTLDNWPKIAAVGSATARLLAERGIVADFMPEEFVGTELVLGLGDLTNKKVLLPRAKIGRPEITNLLRTKGANLTEVALYDTVTAVPPLTAWAELNKGFAAITFTSPSSVRNFYKIMADNPEKLAMPLEKMLRHALIVCIGPITAEAAAAAGLPNALVPDEYTIEGMAQQLKNAFIEVT